MTNGQLQRLALPDSPPLSDIHAELMRTARNLQAMGVTGFFIAFNFKIRGMTFHTAALHQPDKTPARDTLHTAALEVAQMSDLLILTEETAQLKQPTRYTTPTLKG